MNYHGMGRDPNDPANWTTRERARMDGVTLCPHNLRPEDCRHCGDREPDERDFARWEGSNE